MWMIGWRAISARIAALLEAGAFFFRTNDNDNYGSADILIENAGNTVRAIYRFQKSHGAYLPVGPKACLDAFLNDLHQRFGGVDENNPFGTPGGFSGVTGVVTSLASFRAEFEYLTADTEYLARSGNSRLYSPSTKHCRR